MDATTILHSHVRSTGIRRTRKRRSLFAGKRVHLIGVGGCGMRGAAALLLKQGAIVSGSDRAVFEGQDDLIASGATITIGQQAANLPAHPDMVVHSAAVPGSNPELSAARARGCRVLKYAELLGEIMRFRTGIAIAGTHGKSTTSALTTHLFKSAGHDPSFVIGAHVPQLGGGSGVGLGEHFIVEACEFNRSFLHLRPRAAAILNIEADHLDCYSGIDQIVEAFGNFAGLLPSDGMIVVPHGDPLSAAAVNATGARVETFGFAQGATWRATNYIVDRGRYTFDVLFEDTPLLRTSLSIAGRHNVTNALAAAAFAWNAGVTRDQIADGLASFQGVQRRMSLRGSARGITVVDDYAHHPTEVRVTLQALRDRYAPRRLWVVFQPHQHSRTRIFMDDFARSFTDADEVIIPQIYRSRDNDSDVDEDRAAMLANRIEQNSRKVRYIPGLDTIASVIESEAADGDLVITMGAGDVWRLADDVVERLQRHA